MFIVTNGTLAIVLCIVTMLCWGSWGNTQKLAGKSWRYELFYWDYCVGILLFSVLLGLTLGSNGEQGQPFVTMQQIMDIADSGNIMPPKATWFEPKLRSGLVIHLLDN